MLRALRGFNGISKHSLQQQAEQLRSDAVQAAGGPARLQVIAVLAGVLALETADQGLISALSDSLEHVFHIDNTQIGLLLAVVSFVGAAATLPMGVLADRLRRRVILMVAIALWGVATLISGFSTSFLFLLCTRVGLGVVVAAAWPCVASLAGDFFPARERAGIYGLILAGELIGVGIGYFMAGEISTHASWRWSFYAMVVPSPVMVWVLWRFLPEPQRGSQSWLSVEDTDPRVASEPHHARQAQRRQRRQEARHPSTATRMRQQHVQPRKDMVLRENVAQKSLWWVMGYMLRMPTYRLLIIASALAYYFLAGLRTFSMIFFTEHYHLSRTVVSALVFVLGIAALVGVVAGGRISERLLARGHITARIIVPGVALAVSVPFIGFGIWVHLPWIAVPSLAVGAAALTAAVAPLDAARLDIVPAPMWGRGEAGRMTLRSVCEGGAPLLFGAVSMWFGGGGEGLMWTFIVMLAPMLAASALAIPARRSYPPDVVTAATAAQGGGEGGPGSSGP